MPNLKKKIYLLAVSALPGFSRQDLQERFTELEIIADLELVDLGVKPASEIGPQDWQRVAQEIKTLQNQAKGFVVLSGLDNILYFASALSFMLSDLSCPVVFTGGFCQPSDTKKMEVRANLINAIQIAKQDIPEVCLMFGNRLLRANQARFAEEISLNVFIAPAKAVLGRIDFSLRIGESKPSPAEKKQKPFFKLQENIAILPLSPLSNFNLNLTNLSGLIINAGNFQQLPEAAQNLIKQAGERMPVLFFSQKAGEKISVSDKAIYCNYLTLEAAAAKFMWALGQSHNKNEVEQLMLEEIAGEIIK
jgi:L-asparaginase